MKKFIKVLVIASAVLAVLGNLFYWGARLYRHIKEDELCKNVGNLETYFDEPVKWVSILAESADVRIEKGDRTGCSITDTYLPASDIRIENGRMYVTAKNADTAVVSGWRVGNSIKGGTKVTVYLSEKDYDNFDLEVGAGNIDIGDITAANMVMQVGAGSIAASGIKVTANAAVQIGVGSIDVKRLDTKKIRIETGSGNVNLGLAESCMDYDINVEAAAGKSTINGDASLLVNGHSARSRDSANRTLEVDCGLGFVTLNDAE